MQPSKYPALSSRLGAAVRAAFLCGTALAFFTLASGPVFAGELDDLKAQFEALQKRQDLEMQALQKRIEQLEAEQKTQKKVLKSVPKKIMRSGNDKVKLTFSGHLNRAVMYANDGNGGAFKHVDNDFSSTRFRWIGTAKVNSDVTFGALTEFEFQSNPSNKIDLRGGENDDPDDLDDRHITVWLDSKKYGRLWLGQGNTASNNTNLNDLSGTSVTGFPGEAHLMAGGITFVKDGLSSGRKIAATMSDFDGLSFKDRIRYDTPKIRSFMLSTSHSDDDFWDVSLYHSKRYEGFRVKAAVAYSRLAEDAADREGDLINGSISVLLANGLNATFAGGVIYPDLDTRDNPTLLYGKLGYRAKWFNIGDTAFAIDFQQNGDFAADDERARSYALLLTQFVDAAATELYGSVRFYDFEQDSTDFDTVTAAWLGMRIKF